MKIAKSTHSPEHEIYNRIKCPEANIPSRLRN